MKIHSATAVYWDSCEMEDQGQIAGVILVIHPGLSFLQEELLQLICEN